MWYPASVRPSSYLSGCNQAATSTVLWFLSRHFSHDFAQLQSKNVHLLSSTLSVLEFTQAMDFVLGFPTFSSTFTAKV